MTADVIVDIDNLDSNTGTRKNMLPRVY